ncbi:hypothetical protein GWA97_04890 [Flavobacterium sp. LaA7.5]|nr:hypothetical protein [Flavobacterium salilacus subsp. altitudinum]
MKIIFTFLLAAFLFASCSTDDTAITDEQSVLTNGAKKNYQKNIKDPGKCLDWVIGSISIDISNGLGNPIVHFGTQVNSGFINPNKPYTVALHLQPIEDCEDLNSNIGNPTIITLPYSVIDTSNIPDIIINPSQIPSICYKWRIEISTVKGYSPACSSFSQWYDAPLF